MKTVRVSGSNGEVLAPFGGGGTFITGKWRKILVTSFEEERAPISVREAVVEMKFPVIFTGSEVNEHLRSEQFDPNSVFAYATDMIKILNESGKCDAARDLKEALPGDFDMCVFLPGTFEFLE